MTFDITHQHALGELTSLRIPAKAAHFVRVTSLDDLQTCLALPELQSLPKYILGGGSNTVFCEDYPGLVIQYAKQGMTLVKEDDDFAWLAIDAGTGWHDCVMRVVEQGLGGIENLALIPGHVGAAPIQNIGAYGVELASVFDHLMAVRLKDGALIRFELADCQFAYRHSIFKAELKNQYAIVSVVLKLSKKPNLHLEYGAIKETLADMKLGSPSVASVADAVIRIRQSKLPDPNYIPNAGSFFRNPIIAAEQAMQLKSRYQTMPLFPTPIEDKIKVSAAWLIEQCGWKGKALGKVSVYDKHALVLVNREQGSAQELKRLVSHIQSDVKSTYNIELEPEVNLIELSKRKYK